ncbi:MAG: outer membrane protein assembly factor BamA [Nitrospirae bacterium]|nr:MAG: outer membrane protein assembly factor BamA [Nitrospirota bacterium]
MLKKIFFIFLAGLSFAVVSFAQELPQSGVVGHPKVSSVKISGLNSISEKEFLYLLDINTGRELDPEKLRHGIKRAFQKGIFEGIEVERSEGPDGSITIRVKEKPVVRSIKVKSRILSGYLKDRITSLKTGDRLTLLKVRNAADEMLHNLNQKGYPKASVEHKIIPLKKDRVDIIFEIAEGDPLFVDKIDITGTDDIAGSNLKISEGDILDITRIQQFQRYVMQYFRKRGHIGAKVNHFFEKGVLHISIDQGKKVRTEFKGNLALQTGILSKELTFFEINEFSDEIIDETTKRLLTLYHKYGYPSVEIAPVTTSDEDAVLLTFYIYEGEKHVIDSVTFDGSSMPEKKMLEITALGIGDNYNPDYLESDPVIIKDFYRSLGYPDAEVSVPSVEIGENNRVALKYKIKEGIQLKFGEILIKGNEHISDEELFISVKIRKNDPYNEIDLADTRRKITELYNKKGFLEARVAVGISVKDSHADVVFNINEGTETLFGKSIITGNYDTRQIVIERELVRKEGSNFDYNVTAKEKQKLYRLGLFNDVETELGEKYGKFRDVIYKVKEANSGFVEFGAGYGEYERQRGFFEIGYKNFNGMNRQGSFRTELSSLEQRFIFSFLEPWVAGVELPWKTLYLRENRKEKSIDSGGIKYRIKRNVVSTGIEKKLDHGFKADLYYDFSLVETSDVMKDIILSKEDTGSLVISGVRPGLMFDTRDNPFDPKSGVLAGVSMKLVSGFLLSETDFTKFTGYINKYQGLTKHVTLAGSIKGGTAKGFRDTKELPLVERFFLGGRTTVRGYDQDSLGPKGVDGTPTGGNAYLSGSFEVRTDIKKGLGVVVFTDCGNVWRKSENMTIADLKYTTGLGLRYNTPVGPFRLDYGHKLNREGRENISEIHFSLGHAF